MSLEELSLTADLFIDKTSILYGASGSGKSKFIMQIMYLLKDLVKQVIVVCPTDPVNNTYGGTESMPGVVPKPLIHYKLTDEIIIKIWKRQEMMSSMYTRANDITILEGMFRRLGLRDVNKILEKADVTKADRIVQIHDQYVDKSMRKKKEQEIEDQFADFKRIVYKRYISANVETLSKMDLDTSEKFTLKYIDLNPHMLLILDDCSADFGNLKSKEAKVALENMFFRGRWANLTTVVAMHDDTLIDTELRKNAFISIFTTQQSAAVYLDRANNGLKSMKKRVTATFDNTFQGHQKLAYIRQQEKFYRTTAEDFSDRPFTFGSQAIIDYCDAIVAKGVNMDKSNEFYEYFSV